MVKLLNFRWQRLHQLLIKHLMQRKNYSKDMIDLLALRVTADFQNKIQDGKVTVEDIQDSVENVLIQAGYSDVAKAYILYRKQRKRSVI